MTSNDHQKPFLPPSSQSEYFELLSAYLDGEVTAEESQKIEELIKKDENLRNLYHKILKLKQGIQHIPFPSSHVPPEQLSAKIFTRVRQQHRRRQWLWGSGAIAALSIFTLSSLLVKNRLYFPQFANNKESELLMIAVNRPTVDISSNYPLQTQLMIPLNRPAVDIPK